MAGNIDTEFGASSTELIKYEPGKKVQRLVLIEYQPPFHATEVFELLTWLDIVYRISTVLSGFRHARLLVLTPTLHTATNEEVFYGKVWDYGDDDTKKGVLQANGMEWVYDQSSELRYCGWSRLGDEEVSREAASLAKLDYYLTDNNCETFCERLAKTLVDDIDPTQNALTDPSEPHLQKQPSWSHLNPQALKLYPDQWGAKTISLKLTMQFFAMLTGSILIGLLTKSKWFTTAVPILGTGYPVIQAFVAGERNASVVQFCLVGVPLMAFAAMK